MYKLALSTIVAVVLAHSAMAADAVVATVVTVDTKQHTVVLGDQTVMQFSKEVDLSHITPGMKVAVTAELDEDGYSPATAITPVN